MRLHTVEESNSSESLSYSRAEISSSFIAHSSSEDSSSVPLFGVSMLSGSLLGFFLIFEQVYK